MLLTFNLQYMHLHETSSRFFFLLRLSCEQYVSPIHTCRWLDWFIFYFSTLSSFRFDAFLVFPLSSLWFLYLFSILSRCISFFWFYPQTSSRCFLPPPLQTTFRCFLCLPPPPNDYSLLSLFAPSKRLLAVFFVCPLQTTSHCYSARKLFINFTTLMKPILPSPHPVFITDISI